MTKKLICANKINSCSGWKPDREGQDIETIVHSFEDGSTEVFCMYWSYPLKEVRGETKRCMREYYEEGQNREKEIGNRCMWIKYE